MNNLPEITKETHFFPEALKLMKLRHELVKIFKYYGIDDRGTTKDFITRMEELEMELYKVKHD